MSTLQFPPPPESIELVSQNLLTEQPKTPLEQSKLNRWKSNLHLLASRFPVLENSQQNVKFKLRLLFIAIVILYVLVILIVGYLIGATHYFVKKLL